MGIRTTLTRVAGHPAAAGVALALAAGCAVSPHWAREDFTGTTARLPGYMPGANPLLTVRMQNGAMRLADRGLSPLPH